MTDRLDQTIVTFYTTARAGACRLSDGGGPFGFDIVVALLADDLIAGYQCDAIAETGCFLGDTTDYLARRYPGLPVYTCDIEPGFCSFTSHRLARYPNVTVSCEDSPAMLTRAAGRHHRVFAYLDAHWATSWPLPAELDTLTSAVAVIHDFDIGHERFSFDTCNGVRCGPGVLGQMTCPPGEYFTLNPAAPLPVPCLQTGRRAGVAVIAAGMSMDLLHAIGYVQAHDLTRSAEAMP
jgi:hypothetical protein